MKLDSIEGKCFIDTNIFVYALDHRDPVKQKRAFQIIRWINAHSCGVISTQVLQEFFHASTRKLNVSPLVCKDQTKRMEHLEIVCTTPELIQQAIDISILYRLGLYDSLILAAAEAAHCHLLLTEDLSSGQKIRDVQIWNPFEAE